MSYTHVYGHSPLCVNVRPKRPKIVLSPKKYLGATDLKIGMHTQLDFVSIIGWFPPCHTSSYWCVRLKMSKMELLKYTWTKGAKHMNPYVFEISVAWGMFKYTMAKWLKHRSTNRKLPGSTSFWFIHIWIYVHLYIPVKNLPYGWFFGPPLVGCSHKTVCFESMVQTFNTKVSL